MKKKFSAGSEKDSCGAFIVGLTGDLGGGKTTFLQGFAKGFGIEQKITSPTFVIMKKYEIKKNNKRLLRKNKKKNLFFYHIDCYRIQRQQDVLCLGLKEIMSDCKNIVAIEWADRIKEIIPEDAAWINFEFINEKKRKIMIQLSNGEQ